MQTLVCLALLLFILSFASEQISSFFCFLLRVLKMIIGTWELDLEAAMTMRLLGGSGNTEAMQNVANEYFRGTTFPYNREKFISWLKPRWSAIS